MPEDNRPIKPGKPAAPRTPAHREIKMFTVELSGQGLCHIPMGWIPFAVHTLPGTSGNGRALIWAYK